MSNRHFVAAVSALAGAYLLVPASALALDVPFTETFSSAGNNWSAASVLTPLSLVAMGGPDGSQFATRGFSFGGSGLGEQPILARAQTNFNSSGGAFFGNYLTGGVTALSLFVRHDAPESLEYFVRFAVPTPGGGGLVAVPFVVAPNTWTELTVPISQGFAFQYEGPPTLFGTVFGNVGRVQVGVLVSATLAGTTPSYNFDIDTVRIIPAPPAAALAGLASVVALRRRRR